MDAFERRLKTFHVSNDSSTILHSQTYINSNILPWNGVKEYGGGGGSPEFQSSVQSWVGSP